MAQTLVQARWAVRNQRKFSAALWRLEYQIQGKANHQALL
jgi:hypothetical protein